MDATTQALIKRATKDLSDIIDAAEKLAQYGQQINLDVIADTDAIPESALIDACEHFEMMARGMQSAVPAFALLSLASKIGAERNAS